MGPELQGAGGKCSAELSALEACKQRAAERIQEEAESLCELSRDIWSRPELAYQEQQAHETLTRFFSSRAGWLLEPHYKLDTAFRAEWSTPLTDNLSQPLHVGFLCEYDALPSLGHACGHNLIAEVGAAAALGLQGALQCSQPPRPVKITVLGTPAEEDGGGKIDLIEAGAFVDMHVVFMAHPAQEDAAYLPDVAEHDVTVKYYGKASHAAAYPWEGVNALDAAILAYNNLSVLRQQMKPTWRAHGIIKNGGVKPNIIPSYSELEFYLRAPSLKELTKLQEKADACFKAAAAATGCRVTPNILQSSFLTLGFSSTDFGNVSFVVPGIHPYFYIGSDALNHTEEYTEAAGSKEAQFYALRTAKALAMTALDVLFNPDLLANVCEDFKLIKLIEEGNMHVTEKSRESSGGGGAAPPR
uniref:Peptidase M20 domain-containing protein 2 n=1 Tax=Xenopus tropicalis TaxID=8364 RepID=A0A5S6KQJ9_XENTR